MFREALTNPAATGQRIFSRTRAVYIREIHIGQHRTMGMRSSADCRSIMRAAFMNSRYFVCSVKVCRGGKRSQHIKAGRPKTSRLRLWLHRIIRQGSSARDFVPVQSFKNGEYCMYFPLLNCRNGAKDPLRSADAIVRCCLISHSRLPRRPAPSNRQWSRS